MEFATLRGYERANSSNMGNPNYDVMLDYGDGETHLVRSSSNSSWCYGIGNNWIGKTVSFHATRSGRIDYMKLTDLHDTFVDKILSGGNK